MTNRENLLVRSLLILTLGWSYWEYLYIPGQDEIIGLRDEVSLIEEKIILISNIGIPTARMLNDIAEKFGLKLEGSYYIIDGHNKTLEFLKEMAISGFKVDSILWQDGRAKIKIILE